MKSVARAVLSGALVAAAWTAFSQAAPQGSTGPIESVALIDVMPADQAAAREVLRAYMAQVRDDPGLVSARLVLQAGTGNHFMLLQRFRDAAAADAHARLPFVRAFRDALFPFLGSPYDDRTGSDAFP